MKSATLAGVSLPEGTVILGDSASTVTLTVDPSAQTAACEVTNLTVQGTLDGSNTFRDCIIKDINYVTGFLINCSLEGVVTLGGEAQASLMDCKSNVAGGGFGQTPTVDMGGTGNSLVVRGFSGGLLLRNCTSGVGATSIDFQSGRVIFDTSVVAGTFYIRGTCNITDGSTGAAVVIDQTNSAMTWTEDEALTVLKFTQLNNVAEQDKADIAAKVWDEAL